MAGIDNRIVTMKFDNAQFERDAKTSLSTLEKLKQSMSFKSISGTALKGIGAIGSALTKIGLKTPFAPMIRSAQTGFRVLGGTLDRLGLKNPFQKATVGAADMQAGVVNTTGQVGALEGAVTGVSGKFIALSTIAITALTNITNKAINAGTSLVKSLTLDPISAGFAEYELKMGSIQTILANTARYGTKLPQVTAALDELNKYADKTIYNFGDMTKNIGLFTNSGMRVEEATSIIKGFSNSAAASGTSAQGAASAAYQLSQAMSAGVIRLMDWRSLTNVGMGNANMRDGLLEIAQAMGTVEAAGADASVIQKDFNGSLETGWLTADVMSNYLQIMAGDMSEAEQKALGLGDAQIKAFSKTQKTAEGAATKVRTFTKLLETLREAVGSSWAGTFDLLFGDFNEATKLFTRINDTIGGMLSEAGDRRNELIKGWDKLGGRDKLIEALSTAFGALMKVLKPIGQAFRDIFPRQTAKGLMDLTERFAEFTKKLVPGEKTMASIREVARGLFAILGIGKEVFLGIFDGVKALFSSLSSGGGTILDFAGKIASVFTNLHEFLVETELLRTIFTTLGGILSVPVAMLQGFAQLVGSIFSGMDSSGYEKFSENVSKIGESLSGAQVAGLKIKSFFEKLGVFFSGVGEKISAAVSSIGETLSSMVTTETINRSLGIIQTGLLAGIVLALKNFFSGNNVTFDLSGGVFDKIKTTLGEATGAFENMQKTLQADILIKLAAAIGIMALSLLMLSSIDPKTLAASLGAMTTGLGILIVGVMTLMKFLGGAGLVAMYVVTSAITRMAFSMLLMAFALESLADINFSDMIRGLVALGGVMFILTKALVPLSAASGGIKAASVSILIVSVALNILAAALKSFAEMSWEEMARGLVATAGSLAILVVALKAMPEMKTSAIGLIALGVALNLIASAVRSLASLTWEEMARGLVGVAGGLLIIAGAMKLIPESKMGSAASILVVSAALVVLATALKMIGGMSWEDVGKGLVVIAGALTVLSIALNMISLTGILGATALMIAAQALLLLVPAIAALGSLPLMTIGVALTTLVATFAILGGAAYLLAPLIPVILGLAGAFLLFGLGLTVAGTGAFLLASAVSIMVASAAAGMQIIAILLRDIALAIPGLMAAVGIGIGKFAQAIVTAAPAIGAAFGALIGSLLDAVIKSVPKMGRAFMAMLNTGLEVLSKGVPKMVAAGLKLIFGLLSALNNNVGRIVTTATLLIANFVNGLARNIGRVIQAGVNFIIKFIEGTADAIRNNSERMGAAGADLGLAMVEGMANGIRGAAGKILDAAMAAARAAWDGVKNFFKIKSPSRKWRDEIGKRLPEGMALGIRDTTPMVVSEVGTLGDRVTSKMGRVMQDVEDAFYIDPNLNPTVTPVLDLGQLTREANKMSSLLEVAPIIPTVSYESAADISRMTSPPGEGSGNEGGGSSEESGGDTYIQLEQNLYSPKPIDSVAAYRGSKTLISLAKEALS